MTEVVAALIWDQSKFLICQRPAHKARGLLWEFVGGKVEPGETKEEALIRECQEELAITLNVGEVFMEVTHEYPDLTVHLTLFHATIREGIPQKLEHQDIRWITAEEISEYTFCPADEEILNKLKNNRPTEFQNMVAHKIQALYAISHELEELFPGRHYTPDGHMIGSIGEALASIHYGLELLQASEKTHDAVASDGRMVQIKTTQIQRVALSSEPDWLLVLKIHKDGSFSEEFNGPGSLVWANCGAKQANGQRPISLRKLRALQAEVVLSERLARIV